MPHPHIVGMEDGDLLFDISDLIRRHNDLKATLHRLLKCITDKLFIPRTIFRFCLDTKVRPRGVPRIPILVINVLATKFRLPNGFDHFASGFFSGIISFSLLGFALVVIVFLSVISRHK